MQTTQTYHYVLASQQFLTAEAIDEVLKERTRHYGDEGKEIDFWFVRQPAFLEAPSLATIKAQCPHPAGAIVSTNAQFITWLKLRLEYVITGSFEAPSEAIPDPLAAFTPVP